MSEFQGVFWCQSEKANFTKMQGITRVTQEDGSIDAALAWISASMTAFQIGDREKRGK